MTSFAVCEISGKQYKVEPGKPFNVDYQSEAKQVIEAKVLLLSGDGKVTLGYPYLKESLKLDFVADVKEEKIRVAKFHAKANYRRVTGHRAKMTRVVWTVKK